MGTVLLNTQTRFIGNKNLYLVNAVHAGHPNLKYKEQMVRVSLFRNTYTKGRSWRQSSFTHPRLCRSSSLSNRRITPHSRRCHRRLKITFKSLLLVTVAAHSLLAWPSSKCFCWRGLDLTKPGAFVLSCHRQPRLLFLGHWFCIGLDGRLGFRMQLLLPSPRSYCFNLSLAMLLLLKSLFMLTRVNSRISYVERELRMGCALSDLNWAIKSVSGTASCIYTRGCREERSGRGLAAAPLCHWLLSGVMVTWSAAWRLADALPRHFYLPFANKIENNSVRW